jgi:GMP synthase (glutamine-hydrolysing)
MPTPIDPTSSHGRRVLIVQNGVTDAPIARDHGDYGDWFTEVLRQLGWSSVRIHAHTGAPLPDRLDPDIAGVILTGSPLSVADGAPWVLEMGRWALMQANRGVPLLAVCFGHQAVGEVLGGRVKASPNGREYGTIRLDLTPEGRAHPLFSGIDEVVVQSIHADALVEPPPGATLLASTAHTEWQAFSVGSRLWAVQFHPELPPAALHDLCELRNQPAVIYQDDHGKRIIHNWTATL